MPHWSRVGNRNQGNASFIVAKRRTVALIHDVYVVASRRDEQFRPRKYDLVSIARGGHYVETATISIPGAIDTVTSVLTGPLTRFLTVPEKWLRALIFIELS